MTISPQQFQTLRILLAKREVQVCVTLFIFVGREHQRTFKVHTHVCHENSLPDAACISSSLRRYHSHVLTAIIESLSGVITLPFAIDFVVGIICAFVKRGSTMDFGASMISCFRQLPRLSIFIFDLFHLNALADSIPVFVILPSCFLHPKVSLPLQPIRLLRLQQPACALTLL